MNPKKEFEAYRAARKEIQSSVGDLTKYRRDPMYPTIIDTFNEGVAWVMLETLTPIMYTICRLRGMAPEEISKKSKILHLDDYRQRPTQPR